MQKQSRWLLILLLVLTLTVKPLYVPIAFLFLLLPPECFGDKKRKRKFLWIGYGVAFALLLGWLLFAMGAESLSSSTYNNADIMGQLRVVLTAPHQFFIRLYRSVLRELINLFRMMQGNFLALEVGTTDFEILLYFAALIWVTTRDRGLTHSLAKPFRKNLLFSAFGCVVIVYLMEYLQFTPVDNAVIYGVQGRYFLPIVFPFALAMKKESNEETDQNETSKFLAIALIFVLACLGWLKICEYLYT